MRHLGVRNFSNLFFISDDNRICRSGFSREFGDESPPTGCYPASLPGGNSEWEPPDPFSNSEVKTLSADGSVGSPHVRVGHRQAFIHRKPFPKGSGFFMHGENPPLFHVWGPSLRSGTGRSLARSRRSRGRKQRFRCIRAHPPVRVGHRQAFIHRKPFPKGSGFFMHGENPPLFHVWGPSRRSGTGRSLARSRRSRGRKQCFRCIRAHPPVRVGHRQAPKCQSSIREDAVFLFASL